MDHSTNSESYMEGDVKARCMAWLVAGSLIIRETALISWHRDIWNGIYVCSIWDGPEHEHSHCSLQQVFQKSKNRSEVPLGMWCTIQNQHSLSGAVCVSTDSQKGPLPAAFSAATFT